MFRRLVSCLANSTFPLQKPQIRACAAQKPVGEENVTNATSNSDAQLLNYTQAESEQILNLVNSLKLQELQSYDITKKRADKLITWKTRNGSFRTINDILLVDGFGLKVVQKFYRSLLKKPNENDPKKRTQSRLGSYLTPALDAERAAQIRSCVALRIGVSSVTWARLELAEPENDAPCQLTHWQHHEICQKKLHISDLVQRCLYADHMIPQADCYIFENPQMAQISTNPGSAEQQNISIQKSQITAVLSFAVAKRSSSCEYSSDVISENQAKKGAQVYYLRRFLTARLFNHLVGTERVSSEETILKMMRTHYNFPEEKDYTIEAESPTPSTSNKMSLRGQVQFNSELRQMFANAERYHREFLGQALLMNLAFVRLALLQDAQSIAAVTRSSVKDKEPSVE